ncbi:hypothetical protein DFQ01_106105 [Paenibacillus cellulosilyticus]|uniref:Uncharacterized protein n=1 Tax=Paenibacillus cellulosilyticus TaxID=375489 RepID=A0A2V2YUI2_9BACL|nr:hypothetical protein [Paenibacillus cellulosilyticus]PWW04821.1 hypothetical protein DFQ01_106105 [Paenibacillus cellulosilyticus]
MSQNLVIVGAGPGVSAAVARKFGSTASGSYLSPVIHYRWRCSRASSAINRLKLTP